MSGIMLALVGTTAVVAPPPDPGGGGGGSSIVVHAVAVSQNVSGASGSITGPTVSVSGGVEPYSYQWNFGESNPGHIYFAGSSQVSAPPMGYFSLGIGQSDAASYSVVVRDATGAGVTVNCGQTITRTS